MLREMYACCCYLRMYVSSMPMFFSTELNCVWVLQV